MVLCADLEIPVNDFWTSSPKAFNGLLRGAYQRRARESANFFAVIPNRNKRLKIDDFTGFKLSDDIDLKAPERVSTKDIVKNMSREEAVEFKKKELASIFDAFD